MAIRRGMIISAFVARSPASFASPSPKAAPHSKPTPRGIDFKNPFTMSKRVVTTHYRCLATAELLSSSLGFDGKWWSLSGSNR